MYARRGRRGRASCRAAMRGTATSRELNRLRINLNGYRNDARENVNDPESSEAQVNNPIASSSSVEASGIPQASSSSLIPQEPHLDKETLVNQIVGEATTEIRRVLQEEIGHANHNTRRQETLIEHRPQPSTHLKGKDIKIPKYKGSHDTKTAYDFLVELDKYQQILGYRNDEMVEHVVPLALEDDAYSWYRFMKAQLNNDVSFTHFKTLFRDEFEPVGYRRELQRELEDRTQGCHEPLTAFIRIINEYFERLGSHVSEKDRIQHIIRQMHPEYRNKIQQAGGNFENMRELIFEAHKAQESVKFDREYREPSTFSRVEPSLAYKIPAFGGSSRPQVVNAVEIEPSPNNSLQMSSFDRFTHFHPQVGTHSLSGNNNKQPKGGGFTDRNSKLNRFHVQEQAPTAYNSYQRQGQTGVENLPQVWSQKSDSRSNRGCFLCKSSDHWRKDCPHKMGEINMPGNSRAPSQL